MLASEYPQGGTPPTYEWEVYTLSIIFDASRMVTIEGEPKPLFIDAVPQMPALSLQISESSAKRLGLKPGDFVFEKSEEARRIFEFGVEQVNLALKNPLTEIVP